LRVPIAHNTVTFMKYVILFTAFALSGCTSQQFQNFLYPQGFENPDTPLGVATAAQPAIATLDPTPPPRPPKAARTVAQFDTTTADDRAKATAPSDTGGETQLGSTVASLGSPADPGIWLKTPLVKTLVAGRVFYAANGKSVNLELRPSGGVAGAGSQISLPAMRLLDAPLTGLLDLTVFQN
jgi:hypothetical protein